MAAVERGMDRPLPCPHCRRRFPTAEELAEHVKSHFPLRPWVCAACGFATTTKAYLMRHIVVLHCPVLLWRRGHRCR